MDEIFLPTLHSFANGNIFTGSSGPLRFKASPVLEFNASKEVDHQKSSIRVEYWHGIFCYEKSKMEGEESFPLTEEGRELMRAWLTAKR